jgi:hypothetical protein
MNQPNRNPLSPTRRLTAVCLAVLLTASCHTTRVMKKTSRTTGSPSVTAPAVAASGDSARETEATVLEKIRSSQIDYRSFSARAKLDVQSEKGAQNGISVFVRMQKDSCIWLSVRPVLGIELIRVLITPDSVKMINFFKKTLTARSADSLQQLLDIPYDFSTLQDLLIGNPVMLGDSVAGFRTDTSGAISFASARGTLRSDYVFSPDYTLKENDLSMADTSGAKRASREAFDDYKLQDGRRFSFRRSILLETGRETTALIRFSHAVFDAPLSFPFPQVPDFERN